MNKNTNKETRILIFVLLACVLIASVLLIAVINALNKSPESPAIAPPPTHVEIENISGLSIKELKSILESVGIQYEIIPTSSRMANHVENFEFSGNTTENGKLLIEYGTTVKIYGNDISKDKVIYLTFDDGPTKDNSNDIVFMLEEYGIKASFFCTGKNIGLRPDRIEAMLLRGHIVACHSQTHEYVDIYSSIDAFVAEIKQYENALMEAINESGLIDPNYFSQMKKIIRFPGGTNNIHLEPEEALEYINAVRALGYSVYDWTALTGDAEGNETAQSFIATLDASLSRAKSNNLDLIVLMHDKWSTNEALREILDHLIAEGYYFDTIDHCPEYTFVEK